MLDQLERIAVAIGADFAYGTIAELNVLADRLSGDLLLFSEGYFTADMRIKANRTLEYSYPLSLLLFTPSRLSDKPEQKRNHIDALKPVWESIYASLAPLGTISTARVSANLLLNRTDRNFDGVRITLTLTLPSTAIC